MAARMRVATGAAMWLLCMVAGAAEAVAPPAVTASTPSSAPFAVVGDTVISLSDFQRALGVAMRKKYYHAKPPEAEFAKFQREVGDEVVNRVLLLKEARRRGIQPDRARIDATVKGYDAQYKDSGNWKVNRDRMLAAAIPQLERESLLERLEVLVKTPSEPDPAFVRKYYDEHKELFVEPEQVKLSVILLKVDPSSPQALWNSAVDEGRAVHKRLLAGADFGELARLHSGDRSASQGGEMDYTHRGMLPEAIDKIVEKLRPHEVSEPVQVLEGVAIVRLDDRRGDRQRPFEQVRDRAADLWQRAEGESRWKALIAELRGAAHIRIDESHYVPLCRASDKPCAS